MAYRRKLVTVEYHYDDDSGMYHVGEVDFGISGELKEYCNQYPNGRKEVVAMLRWLGKEIEQQRFG